jgi:hypothetical protein
MAIRREPFPFVKTARDPFPAEDNILLQRSKPGKVFDHPFSTFTPYPSRSMTALREISQPLSSCINRDPTSRVGQVGVLEQQDGLPRTTRRTNGSK